MLLIENECVFVTIWGLQIKPGASDIINQVFLANKSSFDAALQCVSHHKLL